MLPSELGHPLDTNQAICPSTCIAIGLPLIATALVIRVPARRRPADTEVIVMPTYERTGTSLYYEEFGSGYPILLFAPGGMRSSIEFWHKSPFDPTVALGKDFRVMAMDQRNAGQSRAPVTAADGWDTYAADHVALLDHLGIKSCHA